MIEPVPDDSPPLETSLPPPVLPPAQPPPEGDPGPSPASVRRSACEFLILLVAGILILRYFVAEAYVVPTGSMAPTILGFHGEFDCPNCHHRFSVGIDEAGRLAGRPVCPNCGQDGFDPASGVEASGDRLLVQKFLFDLRAPRRWEVAVFQSPVEPDQAYVKRIVGLPGESIQIVDGDVWVDGRIARKTIDEARGARVPVFDNRFQPLDAARFPRWQLGGTRGLRFLSTGWEAIGAGFVHKPTAGSDAGVDWLEYRHWDPDRAVYGPIRDSYPYNGGDRRGGHVVRDLSCDASVSVRPDVDSVQVRLVHGADRFLLRLPVDGKGAVELLRNGRRLDVAAGPAAIRSSPAASPRWDLLEVAAVDHRLSATLGGRRLIEPVDYDAGGPAFVSTASPLAFGVVNGGVEIKDCRVFRDIYYTGELASGSRRPAAVDAPLPLGPGEYFVLGDNSPVSNDSRFWESSPVVRRSRLLGKPFLVHLPGQAYGVRIFGHELGWIPDFREIRYIR